MSIFRKSFLKGIRYSLQAIVMFSSNLSHAQGTNELALWLRNESITWAGPTNGLWTGVSVYPSSYPETITIFLLSSNMPKGMDYVLPTKGNTSYTLVLQDANGKTASSFGEVPPQKISSAEVRRSTRALIGNGISYNYFVLGKDAPNQFKDIAISDVCRVKKEGDYTLFISPMLYKFDTNKNYLIRIDLPTVIKKVRLRPSPKSINSTNQ